MKKNFLLATMALFMTLFATSCSQEEIISDNDSKGGGTVSVAVNIPVNNPVTRAVPNIPEGYKLRCILQLVKSDDNSNIADGRYVQEVTAGSEKVTFTFNAPSDTYKCLFWADYVKEDVDADNIYTTTDLKAIGYTDNAGSEMFNGDVADAFYACSLEPVTGNGALASITLKRPFTKITFKDGQSAYTDYTKITIKDLPAPTGFNVMNGETAGYAGKDAYTDSKISSSELTVENGKWFSAYLFASSNKENLGTDNDIVFELKKADNTSSGELKLNGASITLTENVEVEATVEPKKDGDTSIDVIFPDGMVDPNALAVGDYILKDGTFSKTYDKENAIAVVYALASEIKDNDDISSDYQKSTNITGYAVALQNVATEDRAYISSPIYSAKDNITEVTVPKWPTMSVTSTSHVYRGYALTSILLSYVKTYEETTGKNESNQDINGNSPLFDAYNTWIQTNTPTNTDNISNWYIPSFTQQELLFNKLLVTESLNQSLANILNKTFLTGTSATFFLSSTIANETQLNAYTLELKDAVLSIKSTIGKCSMCDGRGNIRPVLTIFEGISKAQ